MTIMTRWFQDDLYARLSMTPDEAKRRSKAQEWGVVDAVNTTPNTHRIIWSTVT